VKLISVAWKYLKHRPVLTATALFLIIIASFFEGASFGMLIPLIQSMTQGQAELFSNIPILKNIGIFFSSANQAQAISLIFIFIFLLILSKNVFLYLSSILIAKLRFSTIRDLRVSLMNNLLDYDTKFFDSAKTGHLIGVITTETERIGDFMKAVLTFMAHCVRVTVYVLILFLISWKASLAIFLLIAIALVPIELIMKRMKKLGEEISRAIADYNYKLTEILGGIGLIKICGSENAEGESFEAEADRICNFQYKSNKRSLLIIPLSEVLIFGLISLCFLILVRMTKVDIANAFPFIATYLVILARMLTQLNSLNGNRAVAVGKLAAFTNYQRMYSEKGKKTIKSGNREVGKFSNSIEIKNVDFSYISGKEVLKDVNVKIPKGKITAFVGASGAGKSTIINLIARLYDVNSGDILIDGTSIKDLLLKDWRKRIGFVSQDVFIFNTNVKNNISYSRADIGEERVIKAAKAANAHDFIVNLPDKYDTVLGERGIKLSGGQKQRISIARAIMHNPEILILDEATSSLDTETEKMITEAIDTLTKGRTVVAIAHRLSTILHADNIIVLDNGRVVEMGRHSDLLEKNGLYRKLYDTQFSTHHQTQEPCK